MPRAFLLHARKNNSAKSVSSHKTEYTSRDAMTDLRIKVEVRDRSPVGRAESPVTRGHSPSSPMSYGRGRSPVSRERAPVSREGSPAFRASEHSAFVRVGGQGSPTGLVRPQPLPLNLSLNSSSARLGNSSHSSPPVSQPINFPPGLSGLPHNPLLPQSYSSAFPFLLDPSHALGLPHYPLSSPLLPLPLMGAPLTPDHPLLKSPDLMSAYRDPRVPITSFWLHRARALHALQQGALQQGALHPGSLMTAANHMGAHMGHDLRIPLVRSPRKSSPNATVTSPGSSDKSFTGSHGEGSHSEGNHGDESRKDVRRVKRSYSDSRHALSIERLVSKDDERDGSPTSPISTHSLPTSLTHPSELASRYPGEESDAERDEEEEEEEEEGTGSDTPHTPTTPLSAPIYPGMGMGGPHSSLFPLPPAPFPAYLGLPGRRPRDPSKPPPAKKYKCDLCGKAFSRSNTLVTHRRIHTGEKPFKCEICGRAFRQPGNLTRHRLTHTTVKPYVCPVCKKAFNRASNLHTHMRTHTNFKPFVCPYCGKGFNQKVDMKIHIYTHTGRPDM